VTLLRRLDEMDRLVGDMLTLAGPKQAASSSHNRSTSTTSWRTSAATSRCSASATSTSPPSAARSTPIPTG
jgi:hypothetical protein